MQINRIKGHIDPTSTADAWMRSRPRDESRVSQGEMWKVVGLLSDNQENAHLLVQMLKGYDFENYVYERPICGGILLCSGNQGDIAEAGIITNRRESKFQFSVYESNEGFEGRLIILPAPMVYSLDDRAMLFGIIQHELRHYMDFIDNDRKPIEQDYLNQTVSGGFELDVPAYSRNITEMRAHADQASALLRVMGGAKKAKEAIKSSQFGSMMVSDMTDAMMAFIDALDKENGAKVQESLEPPAAVVRSEDHDIRELVGHLKRMCEAMKFSNNVRGRA